MSCLWTTEKCGRTFIALHHAECMASYSADVTVNSSGSLTSKATVVSASFEMMQPCSTARGGVSIQESSLSGYFSFLSMLFPTRFYQACDTQSVDYVARAVSNGAELHEAVLPELRV